MPKTRAQIAAEIAANLPDNTSGDITPTLVRQTLTDIAAAAPNIADDQPTTIAAGGTGGATAISALDNLITAEATVASAITTNLGAATTRNVSISGTTTITGFGTIAAGVMRVGRFTGILTLTHNATSLILPNAGSNITTAANDRFEAVSLGSGNWLVYFYQRANGTALVSSGGGGGGAGSFPGTKTLHVEVNGNDTTGDGSTFAPYLTVQKVYAVIATAADASASNPYLVDVGPGVFTGATLNVLPWTFLTGKTTNSSVTTTLPNGAPVLGGGATRLSFDLHCDTSFATSGYAAFGLANLSLGDGNKIYLDLQTIAGTAGSLAHIYNCYTSNLNGGADGEFRWYGRGLADVVSINGMRSPALAHIVDGTVLLSNAELDNGLSHGNSAIGASNVVVRNSIIRGNSTPQGNTTDPTKAIFTYSGVLFTGNLTMSGHGQVTTDVASWPNFSRVVQSGTPFAVTFENDAYALGYAPTVPGDWVVQPTTVQTALDSLAAAGGSGDVSGPGAATDNALPRFDGTTGKLIQVSGVVVDDSNNVSGISSLATTGIVTQTGASVKPPNSLGAFAVDVTKAWNTKTIAANQTFTFSGTPATANTFFSLLVTNSDSVAHTLTIPSSFSSVQVTNITSILIPASGKLMLTWQYDGTVYNIFGDPALTTGTGPQVLGTSPSLVTPSLGTPMSGNLSACTADGANLVGYRGAPHLVKSANYTTVLADAGKCIFHPASDANARTFTIDSHTNVTWADGTIFEFINMSANSVTIAVTTDTQTLLPTGTTGNRTLAQYGRCSYEYDVATTSWVCSGNSAFT